jgi:hypothetical protein
MLAVTAEQPPPPQNTSSRRHIKQVWGEELVCYRMSRVAWKFWTADTHGAWNLIFSKRTRSVHGYVKQWTSFWRDRNEKSQKWDCQLRHVCLSVRSMLIFENGWKDVPVNSRWSSTKICQHIPLSVKTVQKQLGTHELVLTLLGSFWE